jgi:ribosomal protein L25 (general stress protein Ctc)
MKLHYDKRTTERRKRARAIRRQNALMKGK